MKFSEDAGSKERLITHYDNDFIAVNTRRYHHPVIVASEHSPQRWEVGAFDALTASDLTPLIAMEPEIILLGTGERQQFLPPELMQEIMGKGIGCEVMTTAAACRTYNIILGEGRRVAAGLLIAAEIPSAGQ